MGTRSLTHVYDDDDGARLVTIYQQYDGYPEGVGLNLARFLKDFKIVNGMGTDAKLGEVANGPECLAAQLVAHLKTDVGGVYVTVPGDQGQEYEYEIHVTPGNFLGHVPGSIRFVAREVYGDASVLFDGTPAEFTATYDKEN